MLRYEKLKLNNSFLCNWYFPDDCGVTPLLAAAVNNHLAVCCALIGSNCRVDLVGDLKLDGIQRRLSPVQGAILRGHYDVARLLMGAGSSVISETYLFDANATIPQHLLEEDGCGLVGRLRFGFTSLS